MSRILVTSPGTDWPAAALMAFKRLTGIAPAAVKAMPAGHPLLDIELFRNDHARVAALLRGVIALDQAEGLALGYFELDAAEAATAPLPDQARIDAEVLANILAAAEGRFR